VRIATNIALAVVVALGVGALSFGFGRARRCPRPAVSPVRVEALPSPPGVRVSGGSDLREIGVR
jgi:hypothetical protein